jgi:RimJ/RimL family protein N-acetyltransferase
MRPELETARLRLRQFRAEDVAALVAIYADPEVTRYLRDGRPFSDEDVRQALGRVEATWRRHGFGTWAVALRGGDDAAIGRCGLTVLPNSGEVEIGYHLGRPWWGAGYATEAASTVLAFAFETLRLDEIVSVTHPENRASQAVMRRLGLTYRDRAVHFGRELVVYAIARDAWRGAAKSVAGPGSDEPSPGNGTP